MDVAANQKYLGVYQRILVLLHRHVYCAPVASEGGVGAVEFYRFCVGRQGAGEVFRFEQLVSPDKCSIEERIVERSIKYEQRERQSQSKA